MRWTPIKIATFSLLLVFYGVILLHKIELPPGDDLPRLIKNGQVLFQDLDILTKNVYSYTEPEQPFANHHWLSGVLFYWLHEVMGYGGLVVVKVAIMLSAFTLLFFTALKRAHFWLVAWLSIPTILILRSRTLVRPEIFSYLLIAIFLYVLTDADQHRDSKKIYWLIPLQVLWVNLHLFFGIGVFMTAGFLLEKILQQPSRWRQDPLVRRLFLVLPSLLLACLVNPYGPRGALFSLRLNLTKDFPIAILENQSVTVWLREWSLMSDSSIVIFLLAIIAFGLSFLLVWRQRPYFYAAAWAGTASLGYMLLRAIPFFALVFLPGITANLNDLFLKIWTRFKERYPHYAPWLARGAASLTVIVLLALIGLRCGGYIFQYSKVGVGLSRRSADAADFFIANKLRGPIFNDTDIGSYLIYYLYPQEKVFIDNRFGDAYSVDFVRDVYLPMIQSEEVWQQKQAEYNFNVLFLYAYDNGIGFRDFLFRRLNDPDWVLVHADVYNVILVRNVPENQVLINAYAITYDNVGQRLGYLTDNGNKDDMIAAADIFNLLGRTDIGMQTFLKIVATWPRSPRVWMILGQWELSFDDPRSPILAMMYLERAISLGQRNAEAYAFLGSAYIRMGLYDQAEAILRKAQRLNKDRTDVPEMLDVIAERRAYEPDTTVIPAE